MKLLVLLPLVAAAMELGGAQGCCSTDQDCLEKLRDEDAVRVLKGGDVGDRLESGSVAQSQKTEKRQGYSKVGPPQFSFGESCSTLSLSLSTLLPNPRQEANSERLHESNRSVSWCRSPWICLADTGFGGIRRPERVNLDLAAGNGGC